MNRRHVLGFVALVALVLTSGCLGFFGSGSIADSQLDEPPAEPYEWNQSADAHLTVIADATFQAVYRVDDESIELFRRDGFGGRNALGISSVRYRYPNGTVINGSEFDAHGGSIERTRDEVTVTLPTDGPPGQLAFTSESTPKRFSLPTFVKGSYEVVLPPDRRVDFFLFGNVRPGGYATETVDGRTHIRWDEVTAQGIAVQFYLQRDLYVFGVAVAGLAAVGLGGLTYYRRQIERLRRRRTEMGLDTESDENSDRGPPPGRR